MVMRHVSEKVPLWPAAWSLTVHFALLITPTCGIKYFFLMIILILFYAFSSNFQPPNTYGVWCFGLFGPHFEVQFGAASNAHVCRFPTVVLSAVACVLRITCFMFVYLFSLDSTFNSSPPIYVILDT